MRRKVVQTEPPALQVVDVWRADLDAKGLANSLRRLLSRDELQRAERFRFERDRLRFIAARGLLRSLLANYVGLDADQIQFSYGHAGKPALLGAGADPTLHFNVSHADSAGLFAFTRAGAVGVDVESIRPLPELDSLAARYFSAAETAALQVIDPAHRNAAFFRCWTRKEAFIKALGEGLGHPLDSFSVTVERDDSIKLEWSAHDPSAKPRWTLAHLDLGPTCVGAVAIRSPNARVILHDLPPDGIPFRTPSPLIAIRAGGRPALSCG